MGKVILKNYNIGFVDTNLDVELQRIGAQRLILACFSTNKCVETTVRIAGNLSYDN